ncbi:MAG TPA: cytochrome c oxidase subunit 4 [Dehalococcoidia bacterium]|nr:cytochrome c oxidase subunit 4 [Dehalococcoidia bacterium]
MSHQSGAPEAAPEPIHLPPPSISPLVLAGGISLLTAGIAVGPVVGVVGLILLIVGLAAWIQEMRRGH